MRAYVLQPTFFFKIVKPIKRKAWWIMKNFYKTCIMGVCITTALLFKTGHAHASHAQGADISYQCLGGSSYQITVSFYRDCAGVAAPASVTVNSSSASCAQNFNTTLFPVVATGQEVTSICPSMTTTCTGGTYPGVQEYKYRGTINLPASCTDWIFSFTLCCRNGAISTINAPGSENIYVEARLDNLNYPCNNSPVFSNPPVPFICVNQTYCFNHGATDADGDSLVYSLITPMTGPATTVTYLAGYSASQPLNSLPGVSINSTNGDICMTPQILQVTVMAVLVQEYRSGVLIGTVVRDIQVQVMNCSNTLPTVTGINGTTNYTLTTCAGAPISFFVNSADEDPGQTVSLSWNSGIAAGTFSTTGLPYPTGTFTWTPTAADISTVPYCFTVTVTDDACPFNGSQTFSYCITVTGFTVNVATTNANCGASNGSATATPVGGTGPYTYSWSAGSTMPFQNGMTAGNYSVTVTDATGCAITTPFTILPGTPPGNLTLNPTNVSCYGGTDGGVTTTMTGSGSPYSYSWSNGDTTSAITNVPIGAYTVTVTTSAGCVIIDSITITQPASPLSATVNKNEVTCNGLNNGDAMVIVTGGTAPYVYSWSTGSTAFSVTGLSAGTYNCAIVDANGCGLYEVITITEPPAIQVLSTTIVNVSCNGLSNGSANIVTTGGTGVLSVSWTTTPVQTGNTAINLSAGTVSYTVGDANGCSIGNSVTITQPSPLVLTVNSTNVTCYGYSNATIQGIASGGSLPYTLLMNGGLIGNGVINPGLNGGLYTVLLTDANGCSASQIISITEPAPLTIMTAPNDTICPGTSITVYAYATGGSGTYNYAWNNGIPNVSTQVVSPTSNTTYTVNVTDANGCSAAPGNTTLIINDINNAVLTTTGGGAVCLGQPVTVSANVTNGYGTYVYNWSSGMFAGAGPHTFNPSSSGSITVSITDICGNTANASIPYTVNPLPNASLSPMDAHSCGSVTALFTANNAMQPGETFIWNINGYVISGENPNYLFASSGTYPVSLTVQNSFGCTSTVTTIIVIDVYPQAVAVIDATTLSTDEFHPNIQFINASMNAESYIWNFGDGSTSLEFAPDYTYNGAATYTVSMIANNRYNCADTAYLEITVYPEYTLYIPNAFTPDGDGTNDVFFAKGTYIKEFEMMIFDRWGELLYMSNSLDQGWDGTYRGILSKEDVYVYKIKYKTNRDEVLASEGHVTLLK